MLHVDGSSTSTGGGAGIYFQGPNGEELEFALKLDFLVSNNEAEYEALLAGLKMAVETGIKNLIAYTDSQLVEKQFKGLFETKEDSMIKYLALVNKHVSRLDAFQLEYIRRTENTRADALSKFGNLIEGIKTRKVTNREIVKLLKKRLSEAGGAWLDELPWVIWANRTKERAATGETPFSLVYGSEAVAPAELEVTSPRTDMYNESDNTDKRNFELDQAEAKRERASTRIQAYKTTMARAYDKNVRLKSFQVGDLVLKRVDVSKQKVSSTAIGKGLSK